MAESVLVTGGAGFLGYHTCILLIEQGYQVIALDSMNDYYSPKLKRDRVADLKSKGVIFQHLDITNTSILSGVFAKYEPQYVIHLAAQAGVRYSIDNPMAYTQSNLVGFTSLLENCRYYKPRHVLYASSSSVYGNIEVPFREDSILGDPLSYYAITKRTNEQTAQWFNVQTNIPITGLRFFTAYGPWGRPDMAYWGFSDKIINGQDITLYGHAVARDFTYCLDVVHAINLLMTIIKPTHHVVNIGNQNPISVMTMIYELALLYNKPARIQFTALPASDSQITCCDNSYLKQLTGFTPNTSFQDGMREFAEWFQVHHKKYT